MNFEQIEKLQEKEDIFADNGVTFTDEFFEEELKELDSMDQEFIRSNLDLIQQFDEARNQKEASIFYEEAVKTNDPKRVKEVYEFVKKWRQR